MKSLTSLVVFTQDEDENCCMVTTGGNIYGTEPTGPCEAPWLAAGS